MWPWCGVWSAAVAHPLALPPRSWMGGLLPWAAPWSWDGQAAAAVRGPEADGQGTEKIESRRSRVELEKKKKTPLFLEEGSSAAEKHWRVPSPSEVASGKSAFESLISCSQEAAVSTKKWREGRRDANGSQNRSGSSPI